MITDDIELVWNILTPTWWGLISQSCFHNVLCFWKCYVRFNVLAANISADVYLLDNLFAGGESNLDGAFHHRWQKVLNCQLNGAADVLLQLRMGLEQTQLKQNTENMKLPMSHSLTPEWINGLVQDWSNSSALALELLQSCTKLSNELRWTKQSILLTVCCWYTFFMLTTKNVFAIPAYLFIDGQMLSQSSQW